MKTIKVAEATPLQLDWLVAKCEGILDPVHGEPAARVVLYVDQWQTYMRINPPPQVYYSDRYEPSTSWTLGGPILDRERITIRQWTDMPIIHAYMSYDGAPWGAGPTPLIAAMRCYVASKLGREVEVPDELL